MLKVFIKLKEKYSYYKIKKNAKTENGSIALFVFIAVTFYAGFLLLMYTNNLNKVQTIIERIDFVKSVYEQNIYNIDEVYNREIAKRDNKEPIINTLQNTVITNVTNIADTYEEYGPLGGTAEYIAFEKSFLSMKEVVKFVIENNKYEKVDILINAKGNNGKTTTSTQNVEFIRGITVTNEEELNTALASTDSLYISVANDIACSSTINIENVTHKLDLNNHTISYTKTDESFTFITLGSNTNLTVFDSSSEKQGSIIAKLYEEVESDGDDRENSITSIKNNGILTVESGTISVDSIQKMLSNKDGTNVDNTATAIDNAGTVNLNGGTIYTNIYTQGCVYLAVRTSTASGRGIVNSGTVNLNLGAITTNTEAKIIRASGATVWGKTYAYSYGIVNSGTINNSDNVTFTTTVTAYVGDTYDTNSDSANIK